MKLFQSLLAGGALLVFLAGCTQPAADSTPAKQSEASHDEHEHEHHEDGPHGGRIADWGGGIYHAEFTVDHDKQEATVYVLGEDAKTPSPVRADKVLLSINEPAFQLDLLPQPLPGETEGKSSRFVGKHEMLAKHQQFAGTATAEVEGTPYSGDFEVHEGHDH